MSLQQMRSSHVTNTEQQEQTTISHGYHSIPGTQSKLHCTGINTQTYLEKTTVLVLLLGRASLAKTTPAIQAWKEVL
jgi:hypothetical protein